jgi:large subunit ribosomal protein L30
MPASYKKAPRTTGLKVTQIKGTAGTKPEHRGTLRALGLTRIGRSNVLPDRPEIRGMLARVPHMVTVIENYDAANETKASEGK